MVVRISPEDRVYYVDLLKKGYQIERRKIGEITRTPIEVPSRSRSSVIEISVDGGDPIKLVEKNTTAEERRRDQFPYADYHEAAVLSVIGENFSNLRGGRSYVVPRFVDHRVNGENNSIITEHVSGGTLLERLKDLNSEIRGLRDLPPALSKEMKERRRKVRRLKTVKEGLISLGVNGLTELLVDLRTRWAKPIDQELVLESARIADPDANIKVYNPIEGGENSSYYESRFCANLELILGEHLNDADEVRKIMDPLRRRVDADHPFSLIKALLRGHSVSGNIILSDCHPGQINFLPNESLDIEIADYIQSDKNSDDDAKEMLERITDQGFVGIIDLGDLRVGHELMDFWDFMGNHEVDYKSDEIRHALWAWSEKRQSLLNEPGDVHQVYDRFQDDLPIIAAYRLIRTAAKSGLADRLFYIQRVLNVLENTAPLEQLKDHLRTGLYEVRRSLMFGSRPEQ